MLTPKSLLTWMTVSRLRPESSAYLAAGTPCSASVLMVRKNQPPLLPSRPRLVRVGEDDAGEICTTPLGAVTEVRIGIETGEVVPPMMAGTRLISTSCLAASTATAPWLWASRISAVSWQPPGPAASLRSRKAISTDLAPAWPNWAAGPAVPIPSAAARGALTPDADGDGPLRPGAAGRSRERDEHSEQQGERGCPHRCPP